MPGTGIGLGAGTLGDHGLSPGVGVLSGFIVEIVLTFVLVTVVFGAAMDSKGAGTIAPLAIGLAVLVDHLVGVPLTGASMNPARSLGPALIANSWSAVWPLLYVVGPLLGGAIAALFYTKVLQQNGD